MSEKSCNIKLISIGKIDKYMIFPILGGIFNFIAILTESYTKFEKYPIVLSIASTSGMSLSFILLIIYKCRNKGKIILKENSNILLKDNLNNKDDKYKKMTKNKLLYILFLSFLNFIITILFFYVCISVKINLWYFDILFLCLFSFCIFKIKIYRHHYLSIIIIILTGIIIDIVVGNYNEIISNLLPNIIKFSSEIVFSLYIIINKYIMEKKFCSPYEVCCYQGIICLILYIIILIISKYVNSIDDFFKDFSTFELYDLFLYLIIIIFEFIYNLSIFLTIKFLTPCHFLFITIIGELSLYINNVIVKFDNDSIIIIIGLIFIFLMTLVFNEIIELNCFGLEKNTKKNINIRVAIEEDKLKDEEKSEDRVSIDNYLVNLDDKNELELSSRESEKDEKNEKE